MKVQVSTRNGWSFIQTWLKVREGELQQSLKAPKKQYSFEECSYLPMDSVL